MALTSDVKTFRYGVPDGHQNLQYGLAANVTVYRGSVALIGAGTGLLKNASSPASTDVVMGIVAGAGNGFANNGPGVVAGTTNNSVTAMVYTGSFILVSGTGSDALTQATNGTAVYLINETTVGATTGSGTRPLAGYQLATNTDDPSIPVGSVAVKLGTFATSP